MSRADWRKVNWLVGLVEQEAIRRVDVECPSGRSIDGPGKKKEEREERDEKSLDNPRDWA